MKQSFLTITALFFMFSFCHSQNYASSFDRLELSFDTISHTTAIPCEWVMERKVDANGKPYFINKDSTRLEFSFFKFSSLPFINLTQTNFETANAYYNWVLRKNYSKVSFTIVKIEENKESGFIIFQIMDTSSNMFYYLFGRNQEIVYGIKLFNKEMPIPKQLDNLRLLYRLNKD